jgi:hypothetical protein
MKTPYQVLGVSADADEKAIAIAYRQAAKTCHPDRNPDDRTAEQRFKQITAARDALKDPELRELYRFVQLKRQHDRRHWRITIASCAVSALVSAGLVGWFPKSSGSEAPVEEGLPVLAVPSEAAGQQHRFELAGAADPAPTPVGEWERTMDGRDIERASGKEEEQGGERRKVLAAFGMALAPAGSAAEAALPGEAAKTCTKDVQRRAAGAQHTGDECALPPARAPSITKPKTHSRAPAPAPVSSKAPSRALPSVIGRGAAPARGGARPKPASTQTVRRAQTARSAQTLEPARPTYAGPNECWINESGVRWIPCGSSGGE